MLNLLKNLHWRLTMLGAIALFAVACGSDATTEPAVVVTTEPAVVVTTEVPMVITSTPATTIRVTTTSAAPTTTEEAPDVQTVVFTEAIPRKLWGDPDFEVNAEASSGLAVVFTTDGGCSIAGNTVSVVDVGECQITASQEGSREWLPASSTVTFDIDRAEPTINFQDRTLTFKRPFRVALWADTDPKLPLKYSIVAFDDSSGSAADCDIVGSDLVVIPDPENPGIPRLPTTCRVKVEAKTTSDNYKQPAVVEATVRISIPSHSIVIVPPFPPEPSADTTTIELTILDEDSNSFWIEAQVLGGRCQLEEQVAQPAPPSPLGTIAYTIVVKLPELPHDDGETCTIEASGRPQDHIRDGREGDSDSLTFELRP